LNHPSAAQSEVRHAVQPFTDAQFEAQHPFRPEYRLPGHRQTGIPAEPFHIAGQLRFTLRLFPRQEG
jgi:hypothetical protein